jgi:hypothetical protein
MHNFMVSKNNNDPSESILTHFSAHKLKSAPHDIYQILQWAVHSKKRGLFMLNCRNYGPLLGFSNQ